VQGVGDGDYKLVTSSSGPPPAINDNCEGALFLQVDFEPVAGNTLFATMDTVPEQKCGEDITAPGVWYFVGGTGDKLAASLCGSTDFDSKISVFEGSCDALICIGGNDDFCNLQSAYEWESQEGKIYFILVRCVHTKPVVRPL